MKAVGYTQSGALNGADPLFDFETESPVPAGYDVLVKIAAIAVNPVDYKVRFRRQPEGGTPDILGWDAVGQVIAIGDRVTRFQPGDRVWYAGVINRPGTNAEFHLVDERIVGTAPQSLDNAAAAALPLTTLTAYEMLFDRLRVSDPVPGASPSVVIIGGAGGVGSISIQLLRAKTELTIIATASRSETQAWVTELGAHYALDHSQPLPAQIEALGMGAPGLVFSTTHTEDYVAQIAEFIAPQGRFGLIDDPPAMDVMPFKMKAVSTHWELMFTRPLYATADMARQGEILNEVAKLADQGKIRSTMTESFGTINATNLNRAHALLESGRAKGKIVLEGF